MRLILPDEFLPCIDDPVRLRIMADYVADATDGWRDCPLTESERDYVARLLLWTADEWQCGRWCRRSDVLVDGTYRLRWKAGGPIADPDAGYSRVTICSVEEHRIAAYRTEVVAGYVRISALFPVAWWDLTPYIPGERKPKRRNGYATKTNAALARVLTGVPAPLGGPMVYPLLWQSNGEVEIELVDPSPQMELF